MATTKARRTSWAAPKQTLSLGPAFDKGWGETILEYMTCSGGASPEDIRDLMKDAKTPVTLHVYAVGHAKAIQEINYVVENFLHEGGVFHGAVEVYGQEFSFGGSRQNKCGIFACKPKQCPMHTCDPAWLLMPRRASARTQSECLGTAPRQVPRVHLPGGLR